MLFNKAYSQKCVLRTAAIEAQGEWEYRKDKETGNVTSIVSRQQIQKDGKKIAILDSGLL